LISEPGTTVRYTCTAFVLLAWVTEILAGANLENVMTSRVIEPLGLQRTCYNAAQRFSFSEIAPTEVDVKTGIAWRGVVHDEASRALGGVAGNAGLFSTAADLGSFARMWLDEGALEGIQILPADVARRALTETAAGESYQQALGWHCDVSSYMSLRAPHGTAGHLGFTGPMLWISPARQTSLVVLNNRVFPTREGPRRMSFLRTLSEAAFDTV
jgi:CubicO group peptidase (beta-lactamase class C family)